MSGAGRRDDFDVGPRRWWMKKAARSAMMAGHALAGRGRARRDALRVLTYHRFGDAHRDPFCVTVQEFERQVRFLASEGCAVDLSMMLAHLVHGSALPPGSVLLTIDDGEADVFRLAWPVLRAHGVPAAVFPIVGRVGSEGYLSWEQLARMQAHHVAVGSHSMSHRSMARLSGQELRHELETSKATLGERLGEPVEAFAYPFGTRRDYSPQTGRLLSELGYLCAFTSQHGVATRADPFEVPRIKVEGGDPSWLFPELCRGGMDGWRHVDRLAARLQRPHDSDLTA